MEKWLYIPGFDKYQVSDFGNVRSVDRDCVLKGTTFIRHGQLLKSSENGGYRQVVVYRKGKPITIKVHRLVAMAFIDNPENRETVNHKDGNKANNYLDNLEWATRSEQAKHRYVAGLDSNKGERHPQSKLTEKQVLEIRKYPSDEKTRLRLAKRFKISRTHVFSIQTRRCWAHI